MDIYFNNVAIHSLKVFPTCVLYSFIEETQLTKLLKPTRTQDPDQNPP